MDSSLRVLWMVFIDQGELEAMKILVCQTQARSTRVWSNAYTWPVHPKIMNVIVMWYSMNSPFACVWNAIDKQYDILAMSVVNIGGELPWLTLSNRRERGQTETLSLALQ